MDRALDDANRLVELYPFDHNYWIVKVCALLGITSYEIPWGYNVGYARCLQSNLEYYLMLSGHYNEWK